MNPEERAAVLAQPMPIPNSYWVEQGRLLAGEYPGSMSRAEAMERVQRLLRAGVTSFIDLTEEGELPAYDGLLPDATEKRIHYRRLPIVDHGLPEGAARMTQILDAIDAELAAGHCVYLHCRAGIGRTGMTVGCHLVRRGLTGEAALDQLQVLWQQCGRSRQWYTIPETDDQIQYIRQWREGRQVSSAVPLRAASRCEAALVGLAIGDALGTLVAISNFDAATLTARGRVPGLLTSGADTAMMRVVAESLLARGVHDPDDQMQRYLQWTRSAPQVAVPMDVKRALATWQWSRKANAGSHDPKNLDPHSLARTAAVAIFRQREPEAALTLAVDVSRTTQQSPVVLDLCRVWAAQLVDAFAAASKSELSGLQGAVMSSVRSRALKPPVKALIDGGWRGDCDDASDALAVTQFALTCFNGTRTFRDALLQAVTTRRTVPSAAALCGALAGAHYGIESIPLEWRRQLSEDAGLRSLARHLSG